jgi:Spy/CpxP family protein refolding chaperone
MDHFGACGHGRFGGRFARLHAEFITDRALRVAEATPEQREKVEAILDKAFAEHGRFKEQHHALHGEVMAALTGDSVDREQLEALRAKHLRLADQGSRQLTAVVGDIAEVLTPEQRQKLAAHARQMFE